MKTKEELNALKKETEELKGKLAELTDEELAQVSGGIIVRRADRVTETPVGETPVGETPVDPDSYGKVFE